MNIWSALLDSCFPPRESTLRLRQCALDTLARQVTSKRFGDVEYLLCYHDPLVQAAIREHKFYHQPHATKLLREVVKVWYARLMPMAPVVLPVPLSAARQRQRGYNQVTELLQGIIPQQQLCVRALRRALDTRPQTACTLHERRINMTDAFVCDPAHISRTHSQRYILVDDVVTTGATMQAARDALTPHLPSEATVQCVALAH